MGELDGGGRAGELRLLRARCRGLRHVDVGLGDDVAAGRGRWHVLPAVRAPAADRARSRAVRLVRGADGRRGRPRSCRAGPTSRTSSATLHPCCPGCLAERFGIIGRFRLRGASNGRASRWARHASPYSAAKLTGCRPRRCGKPPLPRAGAVLAFRALQQPVTRSPPNERRETTISTSFPMTAARTTPASRGTWQPTCARPSSCFRPPSRTSSPPSSTPPSATCRSSSRARATVPPCTARSTGRCCSTCARCAASRSTPQNRRARVEAGALWEDVVAPATEQGLTALHGSSPNVGVVGYSLGGGIGWLARKHGLSAESVLAVEVVTADGALVRADRTQNTELFWALRGGGGGLGVVVAMEIALYEVEELVAGMMIWPWERVGGGPDRATSSGRRRPRTRSARRPGCSRSRRCRRSPSRSAAARSSSSTAPCSAARTRRTRSSRRSASSSPEIDTFGTRAGRRADPAPHGSRAADAGQGRRLPGRRPRRRRGHGDRRDRRPRHRLAARDGRAAAARRDAP